VVVSFGVDGFGVLLFVVLGSELVLGAVIMLGPEDVPSVFEGCNLPRVAGWFSIVDILEWTSLLRQMVVVIWFRISELKSLVVYLMYL